MSQYFYLDGEMKQYGPCSIEELRTAGITRTTKVWTSSMADWDDAGNVPDLQVLFETPPQATPPLPGRTFAPGMKTQEAIPPKPDSWLAWAIITTVLCCWPLGIPAIVQAAKVDGLWRDGQYGEAIRAAKSARQWTLASVIAGIVFGIGYSILMMFGIVGNIFSMI